MTSAKGEPHDAYDCGGRRRYPAVDRRLGSWHARQGKTDSTPMTALAERYVKTVLALGQHDKDYVDAYYGPPEWKREVRCHKDSLDAIAAQAGAARATWRSSRPGSDEMERLRHQYLDRQLVGPRGARPHRQGRTAHRSTRSRRRSTTPSRLRTRRRTSRRSSIRSRSDSRGRARWPSATTRGGGRS